VPAASEEAAGRALGALDGRWAREIAVGGAIGSVLMLLAALALLAGGWVAWREDSIDPSALLPALVLFAEVALAEELLFRGFVFQRLVAGLGSWPAQLLMSGYFLLTHLDALSTPDGLLILAAANIFLASVLFGLAFLRTGSLAMPLGLHLMANRVQGACWALA
jgi:membrane protease YdiL (CAAX protease family)